MILSTFFSHVNNAFRGSDDDAPTSGNDYDLWLNTTNRKIAEWAGDSKNTWQSLFEIRSIGTVSSGTQTYSLDDDFVSPADKLYVTVNSQDIDFMIVKPEERDRFSSAVYISGRDPQNITFVDTIDSNSQIVGGTIYLAARFVPGELTAAGDTIPVDDPYWLVMAVASELAFNDLTYSDKAPDLNAKANDLYAGMVSTNRRGSNNNPRIAQTNVSRIKGPTSERFYN